MSYQYIYVMKGLSKSINGKTILKETWLSFLPGAKIGIIGHNGAGKSTLMRIIAGLDKQYEGEAFVADGAKVRYLPQEPQLDTNKNVFENIMEGLKDKKQLLDDFNAVNEQFATIDPDDPSAMDELLAKQAELQEKIDACDAWNIERDIAVAMEALRCPDKNAEISSLSGGEKRRVALCKILLEVPDMLLLDEPTNHLDAESVSWLENYLGKYNGTVIVITHDRYFLDNVTEWILEIEHGNCVPWHSNYSSWLEQKRDKLLKEEKEESKRSKQLKSELEWVNQSQKARHAKNKARINAYQDLLNQKRDVQTGNAQIIIPKCPRLGNSVINLDNVTKSFGDKNLIENFGFALSPGSIVGIVGPNGAGKSTLFKMITGQEKPDNGLIKLGETVTLGYVDQSRDHLNDNNTVWQEISEGAEILDMGDVSIKSRAYVSAFNFKGPNQQKLVSQLSGGERNRVHLAKLLKSGANVILLDEPSNDLDVDTIRALEDAILEFSGCVMVISHDRWFLDRIATNIIVFDETLPNKALWLDGNYQDYIEYRMKLDGKDLSNVKYNHKKIKL